MKLSEIRPCDNCGKPIAPVFYVLRISQAFFTPATNQMLGLNHMFHGALALAEAMAPESDVIKIFGDEDKSLMTEILLCQECVLYRSPDLALLLEKRGAATNGS